MSFNDEVQRMIVLTVVRGGVAVDSEVDASLEDGVRAAVAVDANPRCGGSTRFGAGAESKEPEGVEGAGRAARAARRVFGSGDDEGGGHLLVGALDENGNSVAQQAEKSAMDAPEASSRRRRPSWGCTRDSSRLSSWCDPGGRRPHDAQRAKRGARGRRVSRARQWRESPG